MKIRLAAFVAITLAGVLAPPAMGAAIVPDRPCFRESGPAGFVGSGFPPGQDVAVSLDGQQIGTQAADSLGRVSGEIPKLQSIPHSERTRTLSMTQIANPALNAKSVFTETKVYVVTRPRRFTPGTRFSVRAGGLYGAGPTLYGHVRGPTRRNLRVGALRGSCGKVSARGKKVFYRGDRPGRYLVQFDTKRRYRGRNVPIGVRKGYILTRRLIRLSSASTLSSPVLGAGTDWVPAT